MGYGINGITDIPKAWRHALAAIQIIRPDAIMAGGCLRDRDEGVPVKDIDIFVSGSTPDDANRLCNLLVKEGWRATMSQDKTYGDDKRRGFGGVIDVQYPACPPLQIIVGDWTHETLLADFDFGICQIMFDGKTITRTDAYRHDRASRVFRLTAVAADPARFERSVERYARIKPRYPAWRFRVYAQGGVFDFSSVRPIGGTVGRMIDAVTDGLHPPLSPTRRFVHSHPNLQQLPRG